VWETHANNPLDNGDNANGDTESDAMDNEDLRPPQSEQRPSSKVPPAEQQLQQQQQQILDNMEAGPSGECPGHACPRISYSRCTRAFYPWVVTSI